MSNTIKWAIAAAVIVVVLGALTFGGVLTPDTSPVADHPGRTAG